MQSLFNFLYNFRSTLLFSLLMFVSFFLLFQNNRFHQSSVVNSSNFVVGTIYQWRTNVTEYFDLRKNNQLLSIENAKYRSLRNRSFKVINRELILVDDTLRQHQYKYLAAQVINSTTNRQNNYLTLNQGEKSGVKPGMGVVSPLGIVGFVKDVSANFSTVVPIIHRQFTVSALIKRTHHFGLLKWSGNDPRFANLEDIAKHAPVVVGDSVVTRGSSSLFPERLKIGVVEEIKLKPGSNYWDIKVRLAVDFSNLYYVYIVANTLKKEQKELEAKSIENAP